MASKSRRTPPNSKRHSKTERASVVDARSLANDDQTGPDVAPAGKSAREPQSKGTASDSKTSKGSERWGRPLKIVASILILYHLLAVLLPPLAFQSRSEFGSSSIVDTLLIPVRGYGQFLYMDRGYAFFAPDPGPSHLIQARIGSEADGVVNEVMYPNLENQWPRLAYHRHFMVSEFLTETYHPPGPPADLAEQFPEDAKLWEMSRQRYEQIRDSIVSHLASVNDGKAVEIRRIEHDIPGRIEFAENPIELNDVSLYRILLDQDPYGGELMQPIGPAGPTELIPAPDVGDTSPEIQPGLPGLGGGPIAPGQAGLGQAVLGQAVQGQTGLGPMGPGPTELGPNSPQSPGTIPGQAPITNDSGEKDNQ